MPSSRFVATPLHPPRQTERRQARTVLWRRQRHAASVSLELIQPPTVDSCALASLTMTMIGARKICRVLRITISGAHPDPDRLGEATITVALRTPNKNNVWSSYAAGE